MKFVKISAFAEKPYIFGAKEKPRAAIRTLNQEDIVLALSPEDIERIRELRVRDRSLRAREIGEKLGLACHPAIIWRALKELGFAYKKSQRASEQDRADVKEARRDWSELQKAGDFLKLVFLIDKRAFKNFMEEQLPPVIERESIVIMDNLSVHKDSFDLWKFKRKGVKIKYLPPYSPDLNPIENMRAK